MSTVYRAVQESLQREVALKVLSPELSEDKEYCEQLINEGKTIAKLAHPNIVTIYDLGVHEGRYYLSMEYVSGGSLRELLDKSEIETSEAVRIFKELAKTLSFAHEQGVVHMDIKPRNVLVRRNGELVLTDFGISKNMMAEEELDVPGFFHASPKYMSPEQIRGKDLDKRTDMYSLGIIFYEMLVHDVPFTAKDAMGIARKHLSAPIPPLPDTCKQYQQLIARLLAKDPSDRLPDMDRVCETLEWIGGKRPDEIGGDTDRLSRDELLSELDKNEEVMSIELTDDGETTVAINSAFNGLDFQTAFQDEVDLDEDIHEDPLAQTDPSLEAPTQDLTPSDQRQSVSHESITFPELDEIELEPLVAKGADNKIWTRLFLPSAVFIVGIYLVMVSILPEQNDQQAAINPQLQEIISTAKRIEEDLAEQRRLQLEQETFAAVEVPAGAVLPEPAVTDEQQNQSVAEVSTTTPVANVLAKLPVDDEVLQEMIVNEEKILELAEEKRRLQEEIAELARVASSAAEVSERVTANESIIVDQSTNVASAEQELEAEFDIEQLPLAKTERIPDFQETVQVAPVIENVQPEQNTELSETESTLIASVEYEPYSETEQVTNTTNVEPEAVPITVLNAPAVQVVTETNATENYVDEMRQEVVDNQVNQPATDVAIVNDSLLEGGDDFGIGDTETIDLGVMRQGDNYVIDPMLEQRLRQYASKVDRLGDGRIRVVLDQQDLYEPDSPELDVAARKLLDRLSYVFRNYSGFSVNVIDRTAQNGSLATRNLSWNRARSASSYLVAQGMESPRIQHRGNSVGDRGVNARGLELILEPMI